MKLPKSPLLIPVLLFTLGAVISFFISFSLLKLFQFGLGLFLVSYLLHFLRNFRFLKTLLIYVCFLLVGMIYFKSYYTPDKNHFQNIEGGTDLLKQIEIECVLGSYSFSTNYCGKIISWGTRKVNGKVLIQQSKDSVSKPWSVGQKILTFEAVRKIKGPLNPGQFSYKDYLMNKKISHQIVLNSKNSIVVPKNKITLRSSSLNLKKNAFRILEKSSLSKSSQGMVKALLFADRDALEESVIQNYTKAGIIHLLALSGLHIGLFTGILMFLLKPLQKIRYGFKIRTIIIIGLLWSFTFFIGFTPSVTRSVTMFSFMLIGHSLHYGKHTFHYTVLSFFVLLLCHPPFLRSIGFQLSYLAVFGILIIHPLFQKLWNPKNMVIRKYWEWTSVCLSAQLAVTPISIYYFHQFPSLFLVSNLLVVPYFGLFLIYCILVLFLLLFFELPHLMLISFDKSVELLNKGIGWIAQQEAFIFDELYHSTQTTFLLYSLLVVIILWGYKSSYWRIIPIGLVLSFLLVNLYFEQTKIKSENSFWIFHRQSASLIGHQKNTHFYYYTSDPKKTHQILQDYFNSRVLSEKIQLNFSNFYIQDNFRMMILDSDAAYDLTDFNPQYILLRNNPKLNIERLLTHYRPKILIADGSNAPWNTKRWKMSCEKQGIVFYDTRIKGALKINL